MFATEPRAPLPGVPFAMAARARRVVAECQPWVRHWRSYARTRRMKTRESERGGAAPNVCSQTRRKLAKSKPSKTTFRPTPVSCGITERSLLCSIKSSLMRDFRARSPLPAARPAADLSQPCTPVWACRSPPAAQGSEASPAARNTLASARIPRASKLLICGLFQKGRVLAQDGLRHSYFHGNRDRSGETRREDIRAYGAPRQPSTTLPGSVRAFVQDAEAPHKTRVTARSTIY